MKKATIGVILLAAIGVLWYLFVKVGEYEIKFTAQTLPGDIIQVVKIWSRAKDHLRVTDVDSTHSLEQTVTLNGRNYQYQWEFNLQNDSSTYVRIAISQKGYEIRNKLLVPITSQPIERDAHLFGYEFYDVLKEHLRITKVNFNGLSVLGETYCVCSEIESDQLDKALGMMKSYNHLVSFIASNALNVDGKPMITVKKWSHEASSLKFDFCFPIVKTGNLPKSKRFTYRSIPKQHALKATYYGNYITSDRAWYYLVRYAHKHNVEINGLPIEVFHNNPNMGYNETEWKAEIYLPVIIQERELISGAD